MSGSTESPELGDVVGAYTTFDTAIERWFIDKPPMPLHEYLGMTREELQEWADHKAALLDRPRLHKYEREQDQVTLARVALAYKEEQ